ncbi:MAG: hypothetical protein RL148_803, partial [Planctomycetota bacterium]
SDVDTPQGETRHRPQVGGQENRAPRGARQWFHSSPLLANFASPERGHQQVTEPQCMRRTRSEGRGEVVWNKLAGTGQLYNNHDSVLFVGPNGMFYVGVLGGVVALRDTW